MSSAPGEKRLDGFGNGYVYERRDRDLIYVWNDSHKQIAVKAADWEEWTVTRSAEQVGLFP